MLCDIWQWPLTHPLLFVNMDKASSIILAAGNYPLPLRNISLSPAAAVTRILASVVESNILGLCDASIICAPGSISGEHFETCCLRLVYLHYKLPSAWHNNSLNYSLMPFFCMMQLPISLALTAQNCMRWEYWPTALVKLELCLCFCQIPLWRFSWSMD